MEPSRTLIKQVQEVALVARFRSQRRMCSAMLPSRLAEAMADKAEVVDLEAALSSTE